MSAACSWRTISIMLHGSWERNESANLLGHEGSGMVLAEDIVKRYFGCGVTGPGFGCLAMIWSLILS